MDASACRADVGGFDPRLTRHYQGVAQRQGRLLGKQEIEGSSPFALTI